MESCDTRRISARTPLYDHAGETIGYCNRDRTRELLGRPSVMVIGTRHRILGLRFCGPDPAALLLSGSKRRRSCGTPHRNENYSNVRGVWHIDRIPASWRKYFLTLPEGR